MLVFYATDRTVRLFSLSSLLRGLVWGTALGSVVDRPFMHPPALAFVLWHGGLLLPHALARRSIMVVRARFLENGHAIVFGLSWSFWSFPSFCTLLGERVTTTKEEPGRILI